MTMLQSVQIALPGVQPARPPAAIETALAVPGTNQGEQTRNDPSGERGAEAERLAREAWVRLTDPRAPVGPPPSFQANVLEVERERMKQPHSSLREARDPAADGRGDADAAGLGPAAAEAYAELDDGAEAGVDIAL